MHLWHYVHVGYVRCNNMGLRLTHSSPVSQQKRYGARHHKLPILAYAAYKR